MNTYHDCLDSIARAMLDWLQEPANWRAIEEGYVFQALRHVDLLRPIHGRNNLPQMRIRA